MYTLTYQVADAGGERATATLTFEVTSVDDPPTPHDDVVASAGTGETVIDVLANDSDLEGDDLTITQVTQGDHGGTVTIQDGVIHYTPRPGFHGTETFTYTVSDGQGGTTTGTVTVHVADGADPREGLGAAGGGCASGGSGGTSSLALALLLLAALRWRRGRPAAERVRGRQGPAYPPRQA